MTRQPGETARSTTCVPFGEADPDDKVQGPRTGIDDDGEGFPTPSGRLYVLLCKIMLLKLKNTCPEGMLD